MAIELIGKIKPKNGGSFPMVDAADVEMPDGGRLSDLVALPYPVAEGAAVLQPERFYAFGTVSTLAVQLAESEDGLAHEFCFEFVAAEDFSGLTITPEPRWAAEPQFVPGKTHQVSILRGLAVMICA